MEGKIWRISQSIVVLILIVMQYQTLNSIQGIADKVALNKHITTVKNDIPSPGNNANSHPAFIQLSQADINAIADVIRTGLSQDKKNDVDTTVSEQEDVREKKIRQKEVNQSVSTESYQESMQLINSLTLQGAMDEQAITRLHELNNQINIEEKKQLLDKIIQKYERNEITSEMLDHILM